MNSNVGDDNNCLAIHKGIEDLLQKKKVTHDSQFLSQNKLDFKKIEEDFKKSNSNFFIIIASGLKGINSLIKFKDRLQSFPVFSIWSGHQYFHTLKNYLKKINTIILPKSVFKSEPSINKDIKKNRNTFLFTTTLPTNLSQKELLEEFLKNKESIPKKKSYTLVMLGGDSIQKNGQIQYFTKKQAKNLTRNIIKLQKKEPTFLLITNGPRTGKFNQETGRKTNSHSVNKTLGTCEIDRISHTFLFELEKNGLKKTINFSFYNFCFGEKSFYKALLGSLISNSKESNSKNTLILPGESTSMISEASSIFSKLKRIKILSYETSAMNSEHKIFIDEISNLGCIKKFSRDTIINNLNHDSLSLSSKNNSLSPCHSAKERIAEKVFKKLQQLKLL